MRTPEGTEFLSTPSARRATGSQPDALTVQTDFYPRPPRGGRRSTTRGMWMSSYFYPRPPRGGRPPCACIYVHTGQISIHALREEGDCCRTRQCCRPANFYPRPPRGGRPLALLRAAMPCGFLSTPSARRATNPCTDSGHIHQFLSTPSARRATCRWPDRR